jgi:eukaryotic-like serine/threonine-protein kinase
MTERVDEDVTAVWPTARDRNERLALVLDRYMRELEITGLPPDLEKLVGDHPDLADELRSYVDSLQILHQMTAGLRPEPLPTSDESPSTGAVAGAKRLGDYEIVREIGRGGMGVVYEARQLSLNRQVALKVLPFAAMLDERQIARFRTEAQAAAQLHHPNIVPVHAVGQERGVHYFAMQFIAGHSLECAINELRGAANEVTPTETGRSLPENSRPVLQRDRETTVEPAFSTRVSTRTRPYCHSVARLVLQAAEALHHAHQLGVLHRDIKPSNLLLDRDGKLWITDFGLARIQTDSGVTISGDIVGTIRYMSPEQAAGTPALVDARSDVYALGATLYELLTLKPAHPGEARQDILRAIESVDPASPRSVNSSVPFDLETITLRALAKSRDERYVTAQEFADDLRRFLAGEPTRARRPTVADRISKWALRHRKIVALAASFLIALTIVSAGAAVMIARSESQTRRAWLESERSRIQSDKDLKLARLVVDRSSALSNELAGLPGAEPYRRAILKDTLDYYKQFISRAKDDPELAADLASTYHKAAVITETLGERSEALDMCRQALAAFEAVAAKSPEDEQLQSQWANTYDSLGLLLDREGDSDAALNAFARAITLQRAIADRQPGNSDPERALAESYSNLGLLQGRLGNKQEARVSLTSSIGLLNALLAQSPADAQLRHDAAIGHNNLSYVERGEDWDSSEESCREAIATLEELVKEKPAVLSYRSDLALCYNNHGAILGHRNDWADACDSYRKAIDLQRQLTRQAGSVVGYRRDLAVSLNNLGQAQQELAELADAIESFDASEEIVLQLIQDYPNELTFRSLGGAVLNNRAMALEASGESAASLPVYEQAIEHQRIAHQRADQIAEYREFLSKHYFNYGRALRAAGQPAEAAQAALERRKLWPDHGEHLGQIAVELAQAAAQLHEESKREIDSAKESAVAERAAKIEVEAAETLRQAAAHGADLAALRASKELKALPADSFVPEIGAPAEPVIQ